MIMDIADFEIVRSGMRDFVGKLNSLVWVISQKDVSRVKSTKTPQRLPLDACWVRESSTTTWTKLVLSNCHTVGPSFFHVILTLNIHSSNNYYYLGKYSNIKKCARKVSDSGMRYDVAGRRREVPIQTLKINPWPRQLDFLIFCPV